MPVDECRIRLPPGTVLYAYELPSPLPLNYKATSNPATLAKKVLSNGVGPLNVADFIKSSRHTVTQHEPCVVSVDELSQQQLQEAAPPLATATHNTTTKTMVSIVPSSPQIPPRSAKDRQTLANIQRSTVARPTRLKLAIPGTGDTSTMLAADDLSQPASISPAPSPEPPLLLQHEHHQNNTIDGGCHNNHNYSNSCNSSSSTGGSCSSASNNLSPCHTTLSSHAPAEPLPPAVHTEADLCNTDKGFIIAYHRKLLQQEVYFLSSQQRRPSLFGLPLVVPCGSSTSHQSLYQSVWTQVSRLVTPLPPSEAAAGTNHAADCDDSLGYEFPFVLRMVEREGLQCAVCPWYLFCRGCHLNCDDTIFPANTVAFLAIDWDPTALHLRYQSALEKSVVEDPSVQEQLRRHTEPISLEHCLKAFTAQETLEYSCQHCHKMQPAAKKLQIWRLPPILIVHFKRFQFAGQKWIKSQKIVQFPLSDFDPSDYLASVPRETLALHRAQQDGHLNGDDFSSHCSLPVLSETSARLAPFASSNILANGGLVSASGGGALSLPPLLIPENNCDTGLQEEEEEDDVIIIKEEDVGGTRQPPHRRGGGAARRRNGSVLYGDALQDFHQHRLKEGEDALTLSYDLYAIACHSGVMEAGHYVSYAKNSLGKWICYNDSSCKEVSETELDLESAYLLFYARRGLDADQYLPSVSGKTPYPLTQLDSEAEAEYKKQCRLM